MMLTIFKEFFLRILCEYSPPVIQMQGRPNHEKWAEELKCFASNMEPALRDALILISNTEFSDLNAINKAIGKDIGIRITDDILDGIEDLIKRNRYAGFICAFVILAQWINRYQKVTFEISPAEEVLPGWDRIPLIMSNACLKVGILVEAQMIIKLSIETLLSVRGGYYRATKKVEKYFDIGRKVTISLNLSLEYFVESFHAVLCNCSSSLLSEVASICWTLGYVIESKCFKKESQSKIILLKNLIRVIVCESIKRVSYDPLLRFSWLRLEDNKEFNLGSLNSFFYIFKLRYNPDSDACICDGLYECYAKTNFNFISGKLTREDAILYFDEVKSRDTFISNLSYTRIMLLGHQLAFKFGIFKTKRNQLFKYQICLRQLHSNEKYVISRSDLFPEIRFIGDSQKHLQFYTNINITQVDSKIKISRQYLLHEKLKAAALEVWLSTNLSISSNLKGKNEELFIDLYFCFRELKGAFFQTVFHELPLLSQRLYAVDLNPVHSGMHRSLINPKQGRDNYVRIRKNIYKKVKKYSDIIPTLKNFYKPIPSISLIGNLHTFFKK